MATTRAEQNYLGAFGYGNEAILNDPTTSRGTYEPPWPAGTKTASVNFGYGPRERSRDAREGHPMTGWKVKGVKSRLAVAVTRRSEPRDQHQSRRVQRAGGRLGRRVRLHARSSGPAGRHPRDARQGTHAGRLFPLHRGRHADLGNAKRRDPDLQGGPLGQRRLARARSRTTTARTAKRRDARRYLAVTSVGTGISPRARRPRASDSAICTRIQRESPSAFVSSILRARVLTCHMPIVFGR